MVGDEVETRKSFSDVIDDNIKHQTIFNQNEKFHKEKIALEKDYNEKRLQLQKELDEKSEKRHEKSIGLTKWLVIANIGLVIATIFMVGVGFWNAIETRKLVNIESIGDFDFKVTTTPNPLRYNGVDEFIIDKKVFPHDLYYNVEIFNGGKTPLNLNNIIIFSKCIDLENMILESDISKANIENEDIILSGQKIEYKDFIASQFFKNDSDLPCELTFVAHTNKLTKSVKIILKEK